MLGAGSTVVLPSHRLIYFLVPLEPWHFLFPVLATYLVSFNEKYGRTIILSVQGMSLLSGTVLLK